MKPINQSSTVTAVDDIVKPCECQKSRSTAGPYVYGFTIFDLVVALAIGGLLMAIAVPAYNGFAERARVAAAISDMGQIQLAIGKFLLQDNRGMPDSLTVVGMDLLLDPWENPYQYLNIEAGANLGAVRKNRNLVPINTDYDLYSMGKDGASKPPLTANSSKDDVIRANNGAYIGAAKDY